MDNAMPRIGKSPKTWFLVADGAGAKVFERCERRRAVPMKGSGGGLAARETQALEWAPVVDMVLVAEPREAYEVGRNATGMVFESVGGARHMSEPRADVGAKIRKDLAHAIAVRIGAALAAGRVERMIVAAPPAFLGLLRDAFSSEVRKAVVGELAQDLTKLDARELAERAEELAL